MRRKLYREYFVKKSIQTKSLQTAKSKTVAKLKTVQEEEGF